MFPMTEHGRCTGSVRLAEQGGFWVGVTYAEQGGHSVVDGTQMFVDFQIPEEQTQPFPVVLIHGGGGQGLDWMTTPDGRPGWRTLLLQNGYAVYTVDRPGHGRSPVRPNGPSPLPASAQALGAMFAGVDNPNHTQWPGSGQVDDPALAQLVASQSVMPDLAVDHDVMRKRGAELLDRIGSAIIMTNSAGGPAGWLMADARPELVRSIVALEPLGPSGPFPLPWGLTAVPLCYEPAVETPVELGLTDIPASGSHPPMRLQTEPARRLSHLVGLPIAVVTGEQSFAVPMDTGTVAYLRQAGCKRVDHLRLADLGIHGNGHLMMLEQNNDEVLAVVLAWLRDNLQDGAA